ncbi:S-adenosyl-L-methionine-dependent methyltransferase [Mycena polygramma]|nr:S-adenosyl-L-methionine-dependent methyltransferase [Mycena polygramma]
MAPDNLAGEGGLADILALADLISSTVRDVVTEYSAAGVSLPSLSSTTPGPFDSPEDVPPKLSRAVRILDAACAQLIFSVGSPGHVILNKTYGIQEPACMLVATDAKIADLLLDKPDGMHVDELSRETGIDGGKLSRVLRHLATRHCFAEVKPDVFANNRLSMKLLSTDPVSDLVAHLSDEVGTGWLALNENLKDPETTSSVLPQGSSFRRAHGCTVFEFYDNPEQKARTERFNRAMIGWGNVTGKGILAKVYPWGELPEDTVVCDVGGGNGHVTLELLKAFPQLKIVVQDLPTGVEQGKELLESDPKMSAALKQRVQYVPLDFFKESPVEDCDVYYIRHVLHDWPADECKKILDSIRKVAKPSSKLFIHEFALQHIAPDSASDGKFEQAPKPLLPNFGMGRVRQYSQDINMMSSFNSQERTLSQFIAMGAASGFEFVKLWDQGEVGLIEFVPKL